MPLDSYGYSKIKIKLDGDDEEDICLKSRGRMNHRNLKPTRKSKQLTTNLFTYPVIYHFFADD